MIKVWLALLLASQYSVPLRAESICVKHGQCEMNLSPNFTCPEITASSFVRRVCYDKDESFMVINLAGTWYPYCAVDAVSFLQLISAPSIGRHYNEHFKSKRDGTRGPFDCRDHEMPRYPR